MTVVALAFNERVVSEHESAAQPERRALGWLTLTRSDFLAESAVY